MDYFTKIVTMFGNCNAKELIAIKSTITGLLDLKRKDDVRLCRERRKDYVWDWLNGASLKELSKKYNISVTSIDNTLFMYKRILVMCLSDCDFKGNVNGKPKEFLKDNLKLAKKYFKLVTKKSYFSIETDN